MLACEAWYSHRVVLVAGRRVVRRHGLALLVDTRERHLPAELKRRRDGQGLKVERKTASNST